MQTTIPIANAPCSWGALEFDLDGQAAGYEQVLTEMQATGYSGTELGDWGFMPTEPEALRRALDARALNLLGAFVPVALSRPETHAPGIERALQTAKLMKDAGYPHAFVVLADDNGTVPERTLHAGRISAAYRLAPQDMEVLAGGANAVAAAVQEQLGMRTVFHHHCAGYVETPEEIESLLVLTDPDLLGLCFDTGHYMYGGGKEPHLFLQKHYNRIWHVHFKDFSAQVAQEAAHKGWNYFEAVAAGVFCELGKGAVDFVAVRNVLQQQAYAGWVVVEQDVLPGMGNPKDCAAANRAFLHSIGL